jgi:transposase-like protein
MADASMSLLETLRKVSAEGEVDVLREGVRLLAQAIMEAEVTELTGVPSSSGVSAGSAHHAHATR